MSLQLDVRLRGRTAARQGCRQSQEDAKQGAHWVFLLVPAGPPAAEGARAGYYPAYTRRGGTGSKARRPEPEARPRQQVSRSRAEELRGVGFRCRRVGGPAEKKGVIGA